MDRSATSTPTVPRVPWLLRLGVFAIPFAVYLAGLHSVGSGDTQPAELLPVSILESGNLDFNEFVLPEDPLPYWFHRVGPRIVSSYPILPGILNVPVYAAARVLGVSPYEKRELLSLITASAISALSVLFLFLTLTELMTSLRSALFLSFAYAFGTCVWSVASRGMWQHGPALLFLSLALWRICRRPTAGIGWSGAYLALAVLSRPSTLLVAIPLAAVAVLVRPDRLAWIGIAAAVPVALHVGYCEAYLGRLLSSGFWNRYPELANFSGKPLAGLAGLLISPSRGLLVFSPFLLFALPGIRRGLRSSSRLRIALTLAMIGGIVSTVVLYSFWTIWWAGHSFGYRFLIEIAPLLTILAAFWWEAEPARLPRTCFAVLLAWSVFVQFLGASQQPTGFDELADRDPRILWSVRDSEIAFATRKLLARFR